jgi:hypothetical protein
MPGREWRQIDRGMKCSSCDWSTSVASWLESHGISQSENAVWHRSRESKQILSVLIVGGLFIGLAIVRRWLIIELAASSNYNELSYRPGNEGLARVLVPGMLIAWVILIIGTAWHTVVKKPIEIAVGFWFVVGFGTLYWL